MVPVPVMVAPPGVAVTVHAPVGKPLNATLPVAVEHVGWVMASTNGADGAPGSLKVAFTPVAEVQPLAVICKSL